MNILGISAYYHDSAAALVRNGEIIAAAQEERFTRKRHDAHFPARAARYCLESAGLDLADLDLVVFYDKPLLKFDRLLETYLAYAPSGYRSFAAAMPRWLKEKLFLKKMLREELSALNDDSPTRLPKILFTTHHQAHAGSAFFPSPFARAAVLCMDGVGEWATTSAWSGVDNTLTPLWELEFPHSLGLLYSAFTYYTGFKVNSGEYKLMGLAPYGEPKYVAQIRDHLIDIKSDGTFRLAMEYFNFAIGLTMTNSRFNDLFGGPPRSAEAPLTQREMDLARSIQVVTEEIVLKLARTLQRELAVDQVCLAGGVALNAVANGRLQREGPFGRVWIQPAAGDAGGAIGAALCAWHEYYGKPRVPNKEDGMRGSFLGPQFGDAEIRTALDALGAVYTELPDDALFSRVAAQLADEKVIGWFQGRMEFGPRALGARSILGDARSRQMQSVMNLKIKYRESFRPFAPVILEECAQNWFEIEGASPYMVLVCAVKPEHRIAMTSAEQVLFGIDKLNVPRSTIPAVTHVDYSARVQTINAAINPRLHRLLEEFNAHTGCPILVNTSFNVRGEPIVCTPADAYRCFMRTEMDYLVIENFLLEKIAQPVQPRDETWRSEFELD